MTRLAALVLVALAAGACGDGADDEAPAEGFCAEDWPHESWATFGDGFMSAYCRSCHGIDAAERHGAPPGVDFDTEAQAIEWAPRILARTVGDDADMPPAGGPPPETLLRVRIWLECSIAR